MKRGPFIRRTTYAFILTASLVIVLLIFQLPFRDHSTIVEVTFSSFTNGRRRDQTDHHFAAYSSSNKSSSTSSSSRFRSKLKSIQENTSACVEKMRSTVLPDAVRHMALELLAILLTALEEAGVNYVLDAGTLMGSYRHHCLIPWDDDFDLLIDERDHSKFITLFKPTQLSISCFILLNILQNIIKCNYLKPH